MTRLLVPLPYDVSQLAHGRHLRVVNLLCALKKSCDITCLVPDASLYERAVSVLDGITIRDASQCDDGTAPELPVSGLAHRALRFFSHHPQLERAMQLEADDCDAALAFDLPALAPILAAKAAHPELFILFDAIDDPWLTWKGQSIRQRCTLTGLKTAAMLRVLRQRHLRMADLCMAVAPQDAASLSKALAREVAVVPNGIHLPPTTPNAPREPLVVFTGAMSFPPNIAAAQHFARRIWPRVLTNLTSSTRNIRPRLAIVGADPVPSVRALADREGVEVTGRVEDLHAWLRRARVAVAPMVSGSGMKNKILEACANGCPVVSTSHGVGGLPTGASAGILVADEPAEFALRVADLLTNGERAEQLGRAAAVMVAERYTWRAAADKLEAALNRTLGSRRRDGACDVPAEDAVATHADRESNRKEALIHAVS